MNFEHPAVTPRIQATTAMYPGYTCHQALEAIAQGVEEPVIGAINMEHVQLCPQSAGQLTAAVCEQLAQAYPAASLRLHANARVQLRHVLFDASDALEKSRDYFLAMADRSHRLGAAGYSVHAGYREHCSLPQLFDNIARLQELFGPGCTVGLEGLYPNPRRPQLMDCWADYEAALKTEIPLAVDVSHLNIVAAVEGSDGGGLVTDLLRSKHTIEVHVSGNDGRKDAHDLLDAVPWWWESLGATNPQAVIFSEANQLRAERRRQARANRAGLVATGQRPGSIGRRGLSGLPKTDAFAGH